MLRPEVGKCQTTADAHRRYFYDEDRGKCINFIYNGCGGNQNNFRSYDDCMDFCGPSKWLLLKFSILLLESFNAHTIHTLHTDSVIYYSLRDVLDRRKTRHLKCS